MFPFKAICGVCKWIAFMLCFYPKCSTCYLSFTRSILWQQATWGLLSHASCYISHKLWDCCTNIPICSATAVNVKHWIHTSILKVIKCIISSSSTLLMCSPKCHILGYSLLPFSLKLYWVIKWSFRRSLIMFWLVWEQMYPTIYNLYSLVTLSETAIPLNKMGFPKNGQRLWDLHCRRYLGLEIMKHNHENSHGLIRDDECPGGDRARQ